MQIINFEVKFTNFALFLLLSLACLFNLNLALENHMSIKNTLTNSITNNNKNFNNLKNYNKNNNNKIKTNSTILNGKILNKLSLAFSRISNENNAQTIRRNQKFQNNKISSKKGSPQNKESAYPNSNEAITSKDFFGSTSYEVPKLSKVLMEQHPKKLVSKEKFMELVKYSALHMTRGELEQVFLTIDTKKIDEISQEQFDNFSTLIILPFEACDKSNDYLLDKAEIEACFKADPKSRFLDFRRRYKWNLFDKITSILSSRGDKKLNFFGYLFLKKSLFAWAKCQSHNKYISLSSFKCAMQVVVQLHRKISPKEVYKLALKYQFRDKALIAPDFIAFLNIIHKAFYFNVISYPNRNSVIDKSNFLKALSEDRLPMNFEEEEINIFYELLNGKAKIFNTRLINKGKVVVNGEAMDFSSFCFFVHYHNLFNKYSMKKPVVLVEEEILQLLDDLSVSAKIVNTIDNSITMLGEPEHLESSLIHQSKRPNEAQFFNSFLEKSKKHKLNNLKNKKELVVSNNFSASNSSSINFEKRSNENRDSSDADNDKEEEINEDEEDDRENDNEINEKDFEMRMKEEFLNHHDTARVEDIEEEIDTEGKESENENGE